MILFRKTLAEKLMSAVSAAFPDAALTSDELLGMLEYPPDESKGDVALPCFRLSKILRSAPPKIASAIAGAFGEAPELASLSVDGGYLNFRISPEYLAAHVLARVNAEGGDYGRSDVGQGRTVVLDYASPNVAKPFHIGHLGTTVIGHSLKLIHEFCGYKCVGINHLGDWGTQFGKMICAFRLWGDRDAIEKGGIDALVALYVKFHEEAEKDDSLNDRAREEFRKLEEHDEENIALWKWFIDISLREYEITFRQLGITFDSYKGESFYVGMVPEQVEILKKKGLLTVDDGATIVDLGEYGMPPCFILKKDGSTIYHSRDIAAAAYRMRTYNFDKCIYVTSAGQSLHFAQLFKVIELMGYDWYDRLVHVPYGTVSIDGSKLATRTGNVVLLRDLFAKAIEKVQDVIDEKNPGLANRDEVAEAVGVGAVVFHYLYNNRIKDINFIMEDALSFDGATGPYAQYTYARTCSILEKAQPDHDGPVKLCAPEESSVLKTVAKFPEKVQTAMNSYEPSVITRYIIELATSFNRFYQACPILTASDPETRNTRLLITEAVGHTLANALHLICLKTPEKI